MPVYQEKSATFIPLIKKHNLPVNIEQVLNIEANVEFHVIILWSSGDYIIWLSAFCVL